MNKTEFEHLILKRLADTLTEEEGVIFKSYLLDPENEKQFNADIKIWDDSYKYHTSYSKSTSKDWSFFEDKYSFKTEKSTRFYLFKPILSAAIFLIVVCTFLFNSHIDRSYTTKIGEQLEIELPDKSIVLLNSNSKLTYSNKRFFKNARSLSLDGEAYFQVNKNLNEPFQVSTKNAITTVLGTKFNLKSRQFKTLLFVSEGKVQFNQTILKRNFILIENESISSTDSLSSRHKNSISWSKNYISFSSTKLIDVLDELKNYYSFEYRLKPELSRLSVSANFRLDNSVNQVLKSISKALEIDLEKRNQIFLFTK